MDSNLHNIKRMARRRARYLLGLKIHDILFNEWDPLDINDPNQAFDFAANSSTDYDAYQYILEPLVFNGAVFSEISDQLMNAEEDMLANGEIIETLRRRCDVIAVMVARYGPCYLANPFVVCINVETPEAAYQSVLDLVLQTRLDAYEKNWDGVRIGYEKAIEICSVYLPDKNELVGCCLNNLGQALTNLGQYEDAQIQFEKALTHTEFDGVPPNRQYKVCLANLSLNLEYRGDFAAAATHLHVLRSYCEIIYGTDDYLTYVVDDILKNLAKPGHEPTSLECFRLAVAKDAHWR